MVLLQENYTTNTLNQYTNLNTLNDKGKNENTIYTYDKNGNIIQDNAYKYFYDYKNRLVKVTKLTDELVANYTYDILGRRTSKETSDKTITYIYAWQNAIEEVVTDKATQAVTTRENIYSNNLDNILLTIVTNPDQTIKYQYYTKNHLGSTTAITDETGKVLETYIYDIFWKPYIKDGNSTNHREFKQSARGITRLYTGREYDSETNLYFLRARYYSPTTGRFISRDPIDITDDVNLYSYVGNNAVMYVDRSGKAAKRFVEAYDEYLELEEEIFNFDGSFDFLFMFKSNEVRNAMLIEYYEKKSYAMELHYARIKLNTILPENINSLGSNWNELPLYLSWLHQQTASIFFPNRKFLSEDGKYEAVYNSNWILVNDIMDVWTYNFFDPILEKDKHIKYDMDPYIKWGNWINDKTMPLERITWF